MIKSRCETMFEIKKDLERKRIELAISGDEIIFLLPDALSELITKEEAQETDGYLKQELDKFEKGVYVIYIPIEKIKIEGF